MSKAAWILCAFVVANVPTRAQAPSETPTFQELVDEAGSIVLTEVLETTSRWRQLPQKRVIVTEVRLRVDRALKGRPDSIITLTLLGGTVGDVTQQVAGMPRFLVGDNDVLFLRSGSAVISPIVGMSRGRFRVVMGHNGSGRYIANSALQPILEVSSYARPGKLSASRRALTLDEFMSTVASMVRQ